MKYATQIQIQIQIEWSVHRYNAKMLNTEVQE